MLWRWRSWPGRRADPVPARRARDYLKTWINRKAVVLILDQENDRWKRGSFGRLIGRIEIDGVDVGTRMLEKGLAKKWRKK